jgi:hypothetical protein
MGTFLSTEDQWLMLAAVACLFLAMIVGLSDIDNDE